MSTSCVIRGSSTYAFTACAPKSTASLRPRRNSSTASWIVASGKGSRMMNSRNVNEPSPNMNHLPRYQTTAGDRLRQSEAMMPSVLGDDRRVILNHPDSRFGQWFVSHCAFVRFAREHKMGLDFTTPPKRPDPRKSLERTLAILDRPESGR